MQYLSDVNNLSATLSNLEHEYFLYLTYDRSQERIDYIQDLIKTVHKINPTISEIETWVSLNMINKNDMRRFLTLIVVGFDYA